MGEGVSDPLSGIDKIYVISLPQRLDRRRDTEAQLRRIGLDFQDARVEVFDALRPDDAGEFTSIGARGCFLSHLEVLRRARAVGYQSILVLEDDIDFVADFAPRMAAIERLLDRDNWWMFYGAYDPGLDDRGGPDEAVRLAPTKEILTSSFIAYRAVAIGHLIPHLEAMLVRRKGDPAGGPMHFDGALNWFRQAHPEAPVWLAAQPLGWQRSSRTDVHDLAWFDRAPVLRIFVGWIRASGLTRLRRSRHGPH